MSVKYYDNQQNKWVIFPGTIGAPGKSAYELALQQGFRGDLNAWLLSLHGKDAYKVATEQGFVGSEEDFNAALKDVVEVVDKINNADDAPTEHSEKLVLSGGVYDAINELDTNLDSQIGSVNSQIGSINSKIETINSQITNIKSTEISKQIKAAIVDDLTSTDADKALSANQGKRLKDLIDSLANIQISVVDQRPEQGQSNIIYLVKKEGDEYDTHDEYVYVEGTWELIGTTDIDLSDYYTKGEINSKVSDLEGKISANSTSIQDITGNGAKLKKSLTIKSNTDTLLNAWKGETDQTVTITVPTKFGDLTTTKQDIINVLGFTPANTTNAVLGPEGAIDNHIVLFDSTTGKLIKDSGKLLSDYATASHTHTKNQITDINTLITVDDSLSTTSINPVQNKVITTQLNNKVNNSTLSNYVKNETLTDTLANYVTNSSILSNLSNYYLKTETYSREEIDEKIGSAGGGDVMASGNLAVDYIIIGAGTKSIKNSGQTLSNLALKSDIPSLSGYATQS